MLSFSQLIQQTDQKTRRKILNQEKDPSTYLSIWERPYFQNFRMVTLKLIFNFYIKSTDKLLMGKVKDMYRRRKTANEYQMVLW